MNPELAPTIECQDCGEVLRQLSPSEAQVVARRPYGFVAYCAVCRRDRDEACR